MANGIARILSIFLLGPVVLFAGPVEADSVKRITTEAVKIPSFPGAVTQQKLEFAFQGPADGKGWLKPSGQWYMEAWIQHPHFRCAHYRLGVQFGQGSPACLNVRWLTEPLYISQKRQCNNSVVHHSGSGSGSEIAALFTQVSCVQQVIKCSGVCD